MRNPAWSHHDTTRANPMLSALSIDEDLPFEHDQSLVLLRMGVKRGHLASGHPIFDQDERLVSLFSRRLHGPQTPAGKPEALALSLPSDDRPCSAHCLLLSLSRAFSATGSWWYTYY